MIDSHNTFRYEWVNFSSGTGPPWLSRTKGRKMAVCVYCMRMIFLTDVHTGILRIWSVSKTTPLENFRLKKTGFRSMAVLPYTLPLDMSKALSGRADNIVHPPQLNNGTEAAISSSSASTATVIPPAQVLCTFMDGGVGIYDLSKRRWNFLRELVHFPHLLSNQSAFL